MSWTIGSEQFLEINELHFRTVTIDQPRKPVSTAARAVVTSPLKENDIGSTSSSEADTLNSLFGFFDRFDDLPFLPTPVMAHRLFWKVITFCLLFATATFDLVPGAA